MPKLRGRCICKKVSAWNHLMIELSAWPYACMHGLAVRISILIKVRVRILRRSRALPRPIARRPQMQLQIAIDRAAGLWLRVRSIMMQVLVL